MFGLISGALGVAQGVKGLFGGGSKTRQADVSKDLVNQAKGARAAAEQYGFNPLTMLQYGAPGSGGLSTSGVPPLASVQAIQGGLESMAGELNGDQEREQKRQELADDLARVKIEQARAELDNLRSPLGRRAVQQPTQGGAVFTRPMSMGTPAPAPSVMTEAPTISAGPSRDESLIAPGRKREISPIVNGPGVFELDNAMTGGRVVIPGDAGEPWGIDELATVVAVGGPQVLDNHMNKAAQAIKDEHWDGKEWWPWVKEKTAERRAERASRPPDPSAPTWETGNFPKFPYYR